MKAFLACESIAIPSGFFPTLMEVFTALDAASITETVSSPELVIYTNLAAESTAIPNGVCPTLMVAVTFGAAAGFADWPDDDGAGADDCDVFVVFDEQPPAPSAATMSGYVRKATCFIAYLLPGWQPCRESQHRHSQNKTRSTSWALFVAARAGMAEAELASTPTPGPRTAGRRADRATGI